MPLYFQKPENALKRANEFLEVGKKEAAIEILADIMKSRKHRTWQKVHEEIMHKFAQLCVELKKTILFKEVIHQYKNIVMQVNTKTLEDVVRRYLELAEEQTEKAKIAAKEDTETYDVEDLDVLETPESLMLSAVSGEDAQDRKDRTILTPWLKFVWESYRQCLDLLRTSSRLERLYHDVAQMAFRFCVKFSRRTELRKLCDILRNHLNRFQQQMTGSQPQAPTAVNLASPDTQALHMETRFHQLDSAMTLELYMEAFRAVEDIWGLITLSKKPPKASVLANYFTKASLVFWKSDSYLFHAAALHKLFHLNRELKKTLQPEELRQLASLVLCSTLAIPLPHTRERSDSLLEPYSVTGGPGEMSISKQKVLASLLGMNIPPTRISLIRELEKHGVHELVHPELRHLFQDMQIRFHPLRLADRIKPGLEFIGNQEELAQYKRPLEIVGVSRIVLQVSQVYESVKTEKLLKLCPFAGSAAKLERLMTELTRNLELSVRFDHRNDCIRFGLYSDRPTSGSGGPNVLVGEGYLPQQSLSNQLVALGTALSRVTAVMDDMGIAVTDEKKQKNETRARIVRAYVQTCDQTHARMLQRREMIEKRKETWEKLAEQKLLEEEERRQSELARQMKLEEERLAKEHEERERFRRQEQTADLERKIRRERIEELRKTELGARALQNVDEAELDSLDADKLMEMQREQLEKERRELTERIRAAEKKLDFQVRAVRLVELPLLQQQYEEESKLQKEEFEMHERERLEKSKKEHEQRVIQCERLVRMTDDVSSWQKILMDIDSKEFSDELKEWEKKRDEAREAEIARRKGLRKDERRAAAIARKKELRQQQKEEEETKKREEEVKRMNEDREKKEREYMEKKKKLDAQAEVQRRREEEAEAKQRKDREERPQPSAWRPTPQSESGWRARERARNDSWSSKNVDPPSTEPWRPSRDEPERVPDTKEVDSNHEAKRDLGESRNDAPPARRDFGDRDRERGEDRERGGGGGGGGMRRDFGQRRDFGDREERPPVRRDFGDREERPPPVRRDFGDREERPPPVRRDFGDREERPAMRRDFGDRDRDSGGGFRRDFGSDRARDGDRDDKGGGFRRDFGDRDRGGGFRRDFSDRDRGGFRDRRDDDRGGFRRDDDRSFRRDDDRGGFRRDDDRSFRRDDDRGGFRRDDDRSFRRDDDRGGFRRDDDRSFRRDDDRGGFRRDDRDDRGGDRGGFRRGGDDRGGFRRDVERPTTNDRSEGEWRRGGPPKKPSPSVDDDGWTEVKKK